MRTTGLLLSAALASAACNSARSDADTTANPQPGGDEFDDDVHIDCDDLGEDPTCPDYDPKEPDPGEVEPTCDVEFPTLEPVWLVEEPSPVVGGVPTAVDMVANEEALFVANRHDASKSSHGTGSVERRTLEGELVWAVETQPDPASIAWDGQHLYAAVGDRLRRWDADGVEDEWVHQAHGEIHDIAVNDETVALTGSYWVGGVHDSHMEAFYGQVTKTMPTEYLGYTVPTELVNDVGEAVGVNPWGGWIVGGSTRDTVDYHGWMLGYGGYRFTATMRTHDAVHVEAIFPGDDVVYVVAWSNDAPAGRWLTAFDVDGNELSSHDLWVCPGVGGAFDSPSLVGDELVGTATSKNSARELPPLIAKFGLDGTNHGVWEVWLDGEYLSLQTLAVVGERVFAGGYHYADAQTTRVVMEVQP